MNRNDLSPDQRTLVGLAVHEAAHAVVGAIYGATIDAVTLTADTSTGSCDFTAESFGASAAAFRPRIAAAGAVAAAMFHHGPRPTPHQMDAHLHGPDREELRAAAFASMQPMSAPLTAVRPIVRQCWSAIVELATGLCFGDQIGHTEVCSALGLRDRGRSGSAELAMIRDGRLPGSFTVARSAV